MTTRNRRTITAVDLFCGASDAVVLALYEWLKPAKDSGGQWLPDAVAAREARAVLEVVLAAEERDDQ